MSQDKDLFYCDNRLFFAYVKTYLFIDLFI